MVEEQYEDYKEKTKDYVAEASVLFRGGSGNGSNYAYCEYYH